MHIFPIGQKWGSEKTGQDRSFNYRKPQKTAVDQSTVVRFGFLGSDILDGPGTVMV